MGETVLPEFADTMFNSTEDKIQMKARISVTACGTSRRKCKSPRVINNPTGVGPSASRSDVQSRSKRSVDQPQDNEPVQVPGERKTGSNAGSNMREASIIERPALVVSDEKIRIG